MRMIRTTSLATSTHQHAAVRIANATVLATAINAANNPNADDRTKVRSFLLAARDVSLTTQRVIALLGGYRCNHWNARETNPRFQLLVSG